MLAPDGKPKALYSLFEKVRPTLEEPTFKRIDTRVARLGKAREIWAMTLLDPFRETRLMIVKH